VAVPPPAGETMLDAPASAPRDVPVPAIFAPVPNALTSVPATDVPFPAKLVLFPVPVTPEPGPGTIWEADGKSSVEPLG